MRAMGQEESKVARSKVGDEAAGEAGEKRAVAAFNNAIANMDPFKMGETTAARQEWDYTKTVGRKTFQTVIKAWGPKAKEHIGEIASVQLFRSRDQLNEELYFRKKGTVD